jgi:ABC-2 type transport system ATP-binding protein
MKVRELLLFLAALKSVKNARSEVDRWLKTMDLAAWGEKKLEVLSKGMAQKVQFIATVVSRPRLVLLDEPFAGLDPVNTEVLKDAIVELQNDGTTVIFSTHDMSMAERMCDFIFMIFNGRKVLDGTLNEIQGEYAHDTIRMRTDGEPVNLEDIPGIARVNDFGNLQELRMLPGTDPRAVLFEVLKRSPIQSFDIVRPSLHDIFVRIAAPDKQEASHA